MNNSIPNFIKSIPSRIRAFNSHMHMIEEMEAFRENLKRIHAPVYLKNGLIITSAGYMTFAKIGNEHVQLLFAKSPQDLNDLDSLYALKTMTLKELTCFTHADFIGIIENLNEMLVNHFTAFRHFSAPNSLHSSSSAYELIPSKEQPGLFDIMKRSDRLWSPDLVVSRTVNSRNIFNPRHCLAKGLTLEQCEEFAAKEFAEDGINTRAGNDLMERHLSFASKVFLNVKNLFINGIKIIFNTVAVLGIRAWEDGSSGRLIGRFMIGGGAANIIRHGIMQLANEILQVIDIGGGVIDRVLSPDKSRGASHHKFIQDPKRKNPLTRSFGVLKEKHKGKRSILPIQDIWALAPRLPLRDDIIIPNLTDGDDTSHLVALQATFDTNVVTLCGALKMYVQSSTGLHRVEDLESKRTIIHYVQSSNYENTPDIAPEVGALLKEGHVLDICYGNTSNKPVVTLRPMAEVEEFIRNIGGDNYIKNYWRADAPPTAHRPPNKKEAIQLANIL